MENVETFNENESDRERIKETHRSSMASQRFESIKQESPSSSKASLFIFVDPETGNFEVNEELKHIMKK